MLASSPGFINLGLDELAVALENNDSRCIFGTGSGYGPDRATAAARAVLESPLVAHRNALSFARTVIVHVAGGDTMSITEIRTVMETVRDGLADKDVNIFFGTTVKPHLADEIRVTLIASVDSKEFHAAIAAADEAAAAAADEPEDEAPELAEQPEQAPAEEPAADETVPQPEPVADEPTPEPDETEEPEDEPTPEPEDVAVAAPEAEEEPAEEEEEPEDAIPSFTVQPAMHQPELMPATAGTLGAAADGEDEPAAPQTGNLFAEGEGGFVRFSRRGADADDDLDTPPNVNFNSLRGIFPRN
jgi:cell division protein FtsZ